jgi:hypothetical protein
MTSPEIQDGKYQIKPFPDELIRDIREYYISCNERVAPFKLANAPPRPEIKDRHHLPGVKAGMDREFVEGFFTHHGWECIGWEGFNLRLRGGHKAGEGGSSAAYDISRTMFTNFSTSCPIIGEDTRRHKERTGKEGLAMQFIYLFARLETQGDMKMAAKVLSEKFKDSDP